MTDVQYDKRAGGADAKKLYSLSDVIKLRTAMLEPMCF
jgi:hypothetical protein|tara:strand:- start:465 stop:578 length:114 start_codon:yes stop_codon:yes gene_type:complete